MKLLKVFSFLFLFQNQYVFSQHKIEGYVVNADSKKPIENAEVYNKKTKKVYVTNSAGFFESELLKNGDYTISSMAYGFKSVDQNVLIKDKDIRTKIELVRSDSQLKEVVVRNQKIFTRNSLKDIEETAIYSGKKTEVISVEQLTANKATNIPRQIFAQISGLTIFESNDGGLQLNIGGRGLDPNRTSNFNTRQNGYDISADVLGYPESYYTPPTEGLQEIQIIRGAASLQYGTQFGGLINFKMKTPNPDKKIDLGVRQTIGSYNLFTNFNSLSGTLGKFSYYTHYNYKKGDGSRPNAQFESKNYFVNLNYQFSEKFSTHFDYTYLNYLAKQPGGLTDFMFNENAFQSNRNRNWFKVNWNLFALRIKYAVTDKANISVQFFGLNANRKTVGFRDKRVSLTDEVNTVRDLIVGDFLNGGVETRFIQRYQLNKNESALLLGFKYYQSKNNAIQGPGSSGSDADFKVATNEFPSYEDQSNYEFPNQNIAFFGENIFKISPSFSVTPGFRAEHITTKSNGFYKNIIFDNAENPILDQTIFDNKKLDRNFILLGLGLSYKPNLFFEWYGNISQNYRSITFDNIQITNPTLSIDPSITDEKGYTSDIGFRGKYKNYFTYDTSVFALIYKDRIGEILGETANRIRGNIGDAITYGADVFIDWNLKNTFFNNVEDYKCSVFVNTSITQSDYTSSKIKSAKGSVKGNSVEFVPFLNMKTGTILGYKNLTSSIQFTYMSSQFTDASNAKTIMFDNTSGIQGQIPSYYVCDFSLSYQFNRYKIESGINNFTNNYYFTRRATGYPGPGILPSDPRTFYITLQFNL